MKHKTTNGWTKELMKAQLRLNNRGVRSINEIKDCRYRSVTEKGEPNACAAGCFIPNELYHLYMEGRTVSSCRMGDTIFVKDFEFIKFPLDAIGMDVLQRVHDNCPSTENVLDRMCYWIDENVEDA